MEENKTQGEILREKLFHKKENGWEHTSEERKNEIYAYCDGYMDFMNRSKTEREIVESVKEMAEANWNEINGRRFKYHWCAW